jgi:hypothetical protein
MANIDPNQFANQFFGMANKMLTMQMEQTARGSDQLQAVSQNSMAIIQATAQSANSYYYGLANQQTAFSNQIGQVYAGVAKKAVKKLGRGGLLGLLGF